MSSRRGFPGIARVWCWPLADVTSTIADVRFSNRPFGVKHFQTIHQCDVDVARGLVLLFGIGTKALPSWDSKTRRNNLLGGLAVSVMAGPSGHTNSPHPSSREGHHSTPGDALRSCAEHDAFKKVVLAQGLGHANRQAPRDEKGDRGPGSPAGRDHAPHLG
jgi:hypothetical protein